MFDVASIRISRASLGRVLALGTVFLAIGISLGFYSGSQSSANATGRRFRAFVVRQQTTYFTSDSRIAPVVRDRTFAVRTDGSMVLTFSSASPDGETGTTTQIWDRGKGQETVLEPFTQSKLTIQMTAEMWRQAWEVNHPGCPPEGAGLGRDLKDAGRVLGIHVKRLETNRKEMRSEANVAPDLDCFPLRQVVWFSGGSRNETVTLAVTVGEPEESLFRTPEGYIERSPTELEAVYGAKYPGQQFWGNVIMETAESRYRRHNKR